MTIIRLKDTSTMELTAEDTARLAAIVGEYASGASTQQTAFKELHGFLVHKLEPYTEEKSKGGLKLVQGALKKLKALLEVSVLNEMNLTSTYAQPALQLAKASIEGAPEALQFVIDNLAIDGEVDVGDLPGPQFAPARLIVSMKVLRASKPEDIKFFVEADENTGEDTLFLRDKSGNLRRFASLSIEGIKSILRTGTTEPEALDLINRFLGEFTEENERAKPGILGRFISELREVANAGEVPDEFTLDIADSLETAMFQLRDATIARNREVRSEKEREADMKRQEARLNRAAQREDGESRLAPVTVEAGDSAEESEQDEV